MPLCKRQIQQPPASQPLCFARRYSYNASLIVALTIALLLSGIFSTVKGATSIVIAIDDAKWADHQTKSRRKPASVPLFIAACGGVRRGTIRQKSMDCTPSGSHDAATNKWHRNNPHGAAARGSDLLTLFALRVKFSSKLQLGKRETRTDWRCARTDWLVDTELSGDPAAGTFITFGL